MRGISPWAAFAGFTFADEDLPCLYTKETNDFIFKIFNTADSLWIMAEWDNGGRIVFRPAYAPDGELTIKGKREDEGGVKFFIGSVIGEFKVAITWPEDKDFTTLKYTTTLKPCTELLMPFWPRDIIVPGKNGNPANTDGQIQ